jgi:hypothetical protein
MPVRDRYFDPVQIARTGSASAGLEGAAGVETGVLLWGWIVDPEEVIERVTCEIGGEVRPVEVLDRLVRPDVLEAFAPGPLGADLEVGFVGLVQTNPDALLAAGGRVGLTIATSEGAAVSRNRLRLEPTASFDGVFGAHVPLEQLGPASLRRLAEALWAPAADQALRAALEGRERFRPGGATTPRLSIVVVSHGADLVRELLVYLDMNAEAASLELVLVVSDDRSDEFERAVRATAADLSVQVVRTRPASTGVMARVGLDASRADDVVLMSEAMAPPSGPWAAQVNEDLQRTELLLPPRLPRFDGGEHRWALGPRTPPPAARLHEAAYDRVGRALWDWSPGLIAGRRDALAALTGWGAATEDGFWGALIAAAGRRAAPFRGSEGFTYAPTTTASFEPQHLLDVYLLEGMLTPDQGEASAAA